MEIDKFITIREMKSEDIDGAYEVEKECFKTPWSKESIEKDFKNNSVSSYFVVEKEREIIGYIGSWIVLNESQITNIAVKKIYRGMKIGEKLLKTVLKEHEKKGVKTFVLEVRTGNEVALNLYKKMGFKIAGKRPKYYTDNKEDAFIMIREKNSIL